MAIEQRDDNRRLVITLAPPAATVARSMARQLEIRVPELVRRGLSLMRLWLSLGPDEYLAVRRSNGDLERLVLWPETAGLGQPDR